MCDVPRLTLEYRFGLFFSQRSHLAKAVTLKISIGGYEPDDRGRRQSRNDVESSKYLEVPEFFCFRDLSTFLIT